MSQQRYSPEFKDEAVRQVTEKGHSVQEVAARLGVSSHSLYKWAKAARPSKSEERADELLEAKKEILKLRAELRRVQEERDIAEQTIAHPEVILSDEDRAPRRQTWRYPRRTDTSPRGSPAHPAASAASFKTRSANSPGDLRPRRALRTASQHAFSSGNAA